MALETAVIPFSIGTGAAGTTVTVTPGFETKAGVLFWSGRTETTNAAGGATHLRGIGFFRNIGGSITFRCITGRDGDGAGTAVTATGHRSDSCIAEIDSADAFVGWADVQSVSSTQVVFEILDQFVTSLRVVGVFLGGSDLLDATIATAASSGTTQTIVTGMSDRPDVVFLMGSANEVGTPSVAVDSTMCFGIATLEADEDPVSTVAAQAVLNSGSNDAATSGVAGSYARAGEIFVMMANPANAPNNRLIMSSTTLNGSSQWDLDFTWAERAQGYIFFTLAIAFSDNVGYSLDEILTQTDTTTDIVISGKSFTPSSGLVMSAGKAETAEDAIPGTHDEWSIGAFTSASNRFAHQASSRNGNTNMFVQTAYRIDAVYVNQDPTTDAIEGLMDVKSMDSGGVTFIMDDADPAQAWAGVLLLGEIPVATTSLPIFPKTQRFSRKRVA